MGGGAASGDLAMSNCSGVAVGGAAIGASAVFWAAAFAEAGCIDIAGLLADSELWILAEAWGVGNPASATM